MSKNNNKMMENAFDRQKANTATQQRQTSRLILLASTNPVQLHELPASLSLFSLGLVEVFETCIA
jgi:hypothetical protein